MIEVDIDPDDSKPIVTSGLRLWPWKTPSYLVRPTPPTKIEGGSFDRAKVGESLGDYQSITTQDS